MPRNVEGPAQKMVRGPRQCPGAGGVVSGGEDVRGWTLGVREGGLVRALRDAGPKILVAAERLPALSAPMGSPARIWDYSLWDANLPPGLPGFSLAKNQRHPSESGFQTGSVRRGNENWAGSKKGKCVALMPTTV